MTFHLLGFSLKGDPAAPLFPPVLRLSSSLLIVPPVPTLSAPIGSNRRPPAYSVTDIIKFGRSFRLWDEWRTGRRDRGGGGGDGKGERKMSHRIKKKERVKRRVALKDTGERNGATSGE